MLAVPAATASSWSNVDWGISLAHFYLADDIVRAPLAVEDVV
jgi:hypothetical protein